MHATNTTDTTTDLCPNCGEFVDHLAEDTGWCQSCSPAQVQARALEWLENNANHIEHYMLQGKSLHAAIATLFTERRPTCIVCGEAMKHARRNSIICRSNKECRRISRRYVYRYTERGMSKVEALASIMEELGS